MLTHAELKAKALENPEVRQAYEELNEKYASIDELWNTKLSVKPKDYCIEQVKTKKPQ